MCEDMTKVEADKWAYVTTRVYGWYGWSGETVEAGDNLRGFDLKPIDREDQMECGRTYFLEIPSAFLDGIHDDLMGRSNFERLEEDFGDFLYRGDWTYSTNLMVRMGECIPDELWQAIEGLSDYPIYDESDYHEREWKDFEHWLGEAIDDARRDYENAIYPRDISDEIHELVRENVHQEVMDASSWCRSDDIRQTEVDEMYRRYTEPRLRGRVSAG